MHTDELMTKIQLFFYYNIPAKETAQEVGISHSYVQSVYRVLRHTNQPRITGQDVLGMYLSSNNIEGQAA